MIDDTTQEQAVQFVLGELDSQSTATFEGRLVADGELQKLVHDLYETTAELCTAGGEMEPPKQMLSAILGPAPRSVAPGKIIFLRALPWALAAGFAVLCGVFANQQSEASRKVAELEHRDFLSQIRIATLQTKVEQYAHTSAVVVWDGAKQSGLAKFDNLPKPAPGNDYQLWVLDPSKPAPVSAGLVRVSAEPSTREEFRPTSAVGNGVKFALSIEPAGGSSAPRGQILFVGE